MKPQKFFFKSKTVWGAIITFLIAVLPLLQEAIAADFSHETVGATIAISLSTLWTMYGRFKAHGSLFTPHGFPGPSYIPSWEERK
ncbi:hypothetical protein Xen7305DRAFT_00045410 [Xenococcus sp. PCC 7305]|uniref:hypothetical protein n=1 Tax=Xenococcus sp. PCC 7305 TaxID=102125 RepID=UPI0002AD10EC|nr:hypothetical protein [Xenococcus sp. PCC 7305]ELS04805.1 hypothetical protein Xen7305DRAFT_00045410 [Xenococcus sp. PCC 7305]